MNTDPHTTVTRSDRAWLRWSAAWTRQVRVLTGRDDLTVTVAPGAGHGAPACHLPTLAAIEVNAALIGDPTIADPRRPGHKHKVPAAYGALVHEAAHAVHSRWTTPTGTPPVVAAVADMLEESRAEARHRSRRPRDRRWLRHAATSIIAPGFATTDHPWHAAAAAALLLARVDARILTHTDTKPVQAAVRRILGSRTLRTLRGIWKTAQQVPDQDGAQMLNLPHAWCQALGIDPAQQPNLPDLSGQPAGRHLPAAIAATRTALAPTPQPNPHPPKADPPPQAAQPPGGSRPNPGGPGDRPVAWTTRPPTPRERKAAAALAAALRRARSREPIPVRQPSPTPPGRLATRQVIAAQAQAASGAVVAAQPWQKTVRGAGRRVRLHAPVCHTPVIRGVDPRPRHLSHRNRPRGHRRLRRPSHRARPARAATRPGAADDRRVGQPSVHRSRPTRRPAAGPVHTNSHQAARGRLDGVFEHVDAAQQAITGLRQAGCAVLWLQPAGRHVVTYQHTTTTITVADPTTSIQLIADAATRALAHA